MGGASSPAPTGWPGTTPPSTFSIALSTACLMNQCGVRPTASAADFSRLRNTSSTLMPNVVKLILRLHARADTWVAPVEMEGATLLQAACQDIRVAPDGQAFICCFGNSVLLRGGFI